MTFLAAVALFLAPTLPLQTLPTPDQPASTLAENAVASDDTDQKCILILGHLICL